MPWKELYQQTREASPGPSQPDIVGRTAKVRRAGETAKRPHGANCVDIEFYHVYEGTPTIKVLGTKKFDVKVPDLFSESHWRLRPGTAPTPPKHIRAGGGIRAKVFERSQVQGA